MNLIFINVIEIAINSDRNLIDDGGYSEWAYASLKDGWPTGVITKVSLRNMNLSRHPNSYLIVIITSKFR